MINPINPRARSDAFGTKINRDHAPWLAIGLPWLSIMIGSLAPIMPVIAPAPIMPPFGFLMLLGWRLLRPGLLPLWAGLPLGAFDDLLSGQPFGCGIFLFSLTMIAIELIDVRLPWRAFLQDWIVAAGLIATYLALSALLSGAHIGTTQLGLLVPQLLISIIGFPVIARLIAGFDRLRLLRVRRLG